MLLPRLLLFHPPRGGVGAEVSVVSTVSGVLSGGAHALRNPAADDAGVTRVQNKICGAEQPGRNRWFTWASCQQHDWRWKGTLWPQVMMQHSLL